MLTPSAAMPQVPESAPDVERRAGNVPPPADVTRFRRFSDANMLLRSLELERLMDAVDAECEQVTAVRRMTPGTGPGTSLFAAVNRNADLVRRIQEAVRTTLKVHSRSAIEVMPVRSSGLPGQSDVAVIGVLRLTGVPGNSLLALGLSHAAFAAIYENMFGEPLGELSEDNQDLAGELVNIIFQTIDPDLRDVGLELEPSLPIFLTGRAIDGWSQAAVGHALVLPFSTEAGDLFVAIPEAQLDTQAVVPPQPSTLAERP